MGGAGSPGGGGADSTDKYNSMPTKRIIDANTLLTNMILHLYHSRSSL